jgi:TolB-like protein/Flp pilus assembly protein TadD
MPDSAPLPTEQNLSRGDRLDSWKEIANYLRRDVRTVQRWEKTEKLPVHRHLHEKQGTVYAFKSEIDAWARGRTLSDDESASGTVGSPIEVADEPELAQKVEVPRPLPVGRTDQLDSGSVGQAFAFMRRRWFLAALALALAGGGAWAYLAWPSHESVVLAVLPFKNQGGVDQQPLVDGFTRETIARLETVQPDQMGVLHLTRKYSDVPAPQIAAMFNATYVLRGDARIIGQRVSIATQLVRVSPGGRNSATIWSDQYQGDLNDIQRIQADVATAVARAVSQQLLRPQPTQRLNTEAYEAYQFGTFFFNKRTTPDLLKSLDYFNRAVAADPTYAPAYAGLAAAYSLLGSAPYTELPPQESYSKAEAAARKALQLDESLAEAHLALGYSLLVYERNYVKARQEFERALQLRPAYGAAHDYYAYYLTAMGDMKKAIEERETARRLEPVSPLLTTALGEAYYQNRQYDQAILMAQKALELDSSYPVSMINLARSYEQSGLHSQAEAIYLKLLNFAPEDPGLLALLAHEYAVSGQGEKARKIETQLEHMRNKRYVASLYIALIWTGLGERDLAFLWLNRAYDEDCEYLVYLRTEPTADPLRDDPRFAELLRRLALGSIGSDAPPPMNGPPSLKGVIDAPIQHPGNAPLSGR